MTMTSWGRYPRIDGTIVDIRSEFGSAPLMAQSFVPRGNGRSYGDSALASRMLSVLSMKRILSFDTVSGLLECEAGILLSDILEVFVPRGWFLATTPGTKLITVGGAIACDVHGKNHHSYGCFSECVEEFTLLLPDGELRQVDRVNDLEWFQATCGGMGLTGIIVKAKIRLRKISSSRIAQTTIRTRNLEETFEAFKKHGSVPYSVAWIDCLAKGDDIGRCLLMVGDHLDTDSIPLSHSNKVLITVPDVFPSCTLNSLTMRAFNGLYYSKAKDGECSQVVGINTFFYPLDAIGEWNRIYGRGGFTQYQIGFPLESSAKGLAIVLKEISRSGKGSFLSVLKLMARENSNWLSFPFEGYSLALDFKCEPALFPLLDRLDQIVLDHGGRLYLTKDVRMSKAVLDAGYPDVDLFRKFRVQNGLAGKIESIQSKRLGL